MNKKPMILLLCAVVMMVSAKNLWEKFKTGTKKAVKKTGQVATQATQEVGKGAQTAVKKTGKVAETAVKETGKAAKVAVEETKKAGEKVGEFVEELGAAIEKLEAWKAPDGRLRFDEVAYLGAHNAHVNQQEGFRYSQQLWSLENQLKHGVRHFLIDIWIGEAGPNKGKLLLCHGECEKASRAQRLGGKNHVLLRAYLEKIKRFLDTHPKEIISLELENYASAKETANAIDSVPGLRNYILTLKDYDPEKHDNKWPTLNWMISNNKRLVIFDLGGVEIEPYGYGYKTDRHMIRNMYGTHDLNKACELRGSTRRSSRLYQLNYFGTVASPLPIHNTPTQLKKVLKRCQEKGVVSKGKAPNFIALDNVHLGNAMKWVNELNAKAAKRLK